MSNETNAKRFLQKRVEAAARRWGKKATEQACEEILFGFFAGQETDPPPSSGGPTGPSASGLPIPEGTDTDPGQVDHGQPGGESEDPDASPEDSARVEG